MQARYRQSGHYLEAQHWCNHVMLIDYVITTPQKSAWSAILIIVTTIMSPRACWKRSSIACYLWHLGYSKVITFVWVPFPEAIMVRFKAKVHITWGTLVPSSVSWIFELSTQITVSSLISINKAQLMRSSDLLLLLWRYQLGFRVSFLLAQFCYKHLAKFLVGNFCPFFR